MIQKLPLAPPAARRIALAVVTAACVLTLPLQAAAVASAIAQSEERIAYVLLSQGNGNSSMSGSTEDMRRAHALRSGSEALLYVRQGGAAYVIRDAATLRQAQAIFEPQQALGARQAELGSRQAALGARQARLGAEQARLGSRQAGATPQRAVALGREQGELGRQQNELGRQQNVLGQEQAALGREQARLGRVASERIRALVAQAVRSGVAQRVN
jgi:hypothetical protein